MEKDSGKPTFENAIERLEEIVSLMEEGDTPLAELVVCLWCSRFFVAICEKVLAMQGEQVR